MKLTKFNIVTILLVSLVVLILAGRIFNVPALSDYSWIAIFPLFTYLYYGQAKEKNHFFGFFLIGFSVVEMLKIVFKGNAVLAYYIPNFIVIASYASLIIFLIKDIKFKLLVKEFKIHLIVLTAFNVYIILFLNQMIIQDGSLVINSVDFLIEVTYNVLILLVLSLSLVHYLYHETKQGLLLFFASVCIVFSEMVQVAYLFISSLQLLQIAYSLLMGIGFYFLYMYIKIKHLPLKTSSHNNFEIIQ